MFESAICNLTWTIIFASISGIWLAVLLFICFNIFLSFTTSPFLFVLFLGWGGGGVRFGLEGCISFQSALGRSIFGWFYECDVDTILLYEHYIKFKWCYFCTQN